VFDDGRGTADAYCACLRFTEARSHHALTAVWIEQPTRRCREAGQTPGSSPSSPKGERPYRAALTFRPSDRGDSSR